MGAPSFNKLLKQSIKEHGESLYDDLDLSITGLDFLERILIGLIWANPIPHRPDYSNEQRLADALRAIVGYSVRKRSDEIIDDIALQTMATMRAHDIYAHQSNSKNKLRSIRELARTQAPHCSDSSNSEEAAFHRLRRKFAKREKELMENTNDRRLSINTLQQFALDEFEERLKLFGVNFYSYE